MEHVYIQDFLSKYPDIEKTNLDPYLDEDFYKVIFHKKEFYENKLKRVEKRSGKKQPYKHQRTIANFISSHTKYDVMLIFHKPGTGKTCTSALVIEGIKNSSNLFDGAIIIAEGRGLLDNYLSELAFVCTDNVYIPENYDNLTDIQKNIRLKKEAKFYSFKTLQTFSSKLSSMTDSQIKNKYSNKIIVVDEAHILRPDFSNKSEVNAYTEIHRLLHLVENKKALLLTGTPMSDDVVEIASLMNLILPLSDQLPIGEKFRNEYLEKDSEQSNDIVPDKLYHIRQDKISDLKHRFKGRISYLREMEDEVQKSYQGKIAPGMKYIVTYPTIMDEFQSRYYKPTFKSDESSAFYINSRQASLLVGPDGSYGNSLFQKYVIKESVKRTTDTKKINKYTLSDEFKRSIITSSDSNQNLENLKKFSTSYYNVIKHLLNYKDGLVFIFFEFVKGSGAIIFSLILELFGFSRSRGRDNTINKKKYAILTSNLTTPAEIIRVRNLFNSPQNVFGDYLRIIIGSGIVSLGFTLKNLQEIHILTPHWNYSETEQVEARGIRLESHSELIKVTGKIPKVKIFLHVALPSEKDYQSSIDWYMYAVSERKDINIKRMIRLLKEVSFDCSLNYERNLLPTDKDYSRECDYMPCNYICDGFNNYLEYTTPVKSLDYSSYQLFYNSDDLLFLNNMIMVIFKNTFSIRFDDLFLLVNQSEKCTEFEVLTLLRNLINSNIPITNKYEFVSYLREEDDIYFLVDDISSPSSFFLKYYDQYPNVNEPVRLEDVALTLYYGEGRLRSLCNGNEAYRIKFVNQLQPSLQEFLIEASIIHKLTNVQTSIDLRDWILLYFEKYIFQERTLIVSSLLYETMGLMRCLKSDTPSLTINSWTNCGQSEVQKVKDIESKRIKKLEVNPYGYYGTVETSTDKFFIRRVSKEDVESADNRKITTGKVCVSSWKKRDLVAVMLSIQLPYPDTFKDDCSKKTKKDIISEIEKTKTGTGTVSEKNSHDDLCRVLYWSNQVTKDLCNAIKDRFRELGILEEIVKKSNKKKV